MCVCVCGTGEDELSVKKECIEFPWKRRRWRCRRRWRWRWMHGSFWASSATLSSSLCVIVCVRHEHWMSTYWALNSSLLGWFVRAIEKAEGTKKSIGDLENQTWANHVQISHLTCVNCDIHLFCFCFCLVGQLFWITLFVLFNQSPSNVPYLYSHFSPVLNHWLCVTWISLIQIAIFPMLGFFS